MIRILTTFLLVLFTSTGFGCNSSQRVSFKDWQNGLRDYSVNHSQGDLSFLRDQPPGAAHRTFSIISTESPNNAKDATGVLVSVTPADNRPTYVFLLGLMKSRVVEDIRVALLTVEGDRFDWTLGREDENALQTYRDSKMQRWRELQPNRNEPPDGALQFPGSDDVFESQLAGNTLTITERNSQARWVLVIENHED